MPHFMIILIPCINLLNLSWTIKCQFLRDMVPLRKHGILNILKISHQKSDIFHISAQNMDCAYSIEPSQQYTQSMFLRTPDYTLYSAVHACWSEYSDSSFVYGFVR